MALTSETSSPTGWQNLRSERLDHLGLIAGMCREIRLAEHIDAMIPAPTRKVSHGQAVVAMVINAMGVMNRPLYLTPEFYQGKPVSALIGEGIAADDLNDDTLGRTLDQLFAHDLTEIFSQVVSHALEALSITPGAMRHLDTTTFSLHGDYDRQAEGEIKITYGYSKDHRPDLKQMTMALITDSASSLPLWFKALDGNASDAREFVPCIEAYIAQLAEGEDDPLFVADSSLYSAENIKRLGTRRWLTRVPARVAEVRELCESCERDEMTPFEDYPGYHGLEFEPAEDADLPERWLLVFSEAAFARDRKSVQRKIEKEREKIKLELQRLCKKKFDTEAEADGAINDASARWRFHHALYALKSTPRYSKSGRPKPGSTPDRTEWTISNASAHEDAEMVAEAQQSCGKFMLATNDLDQERLPAHKLLGNYKAQAGGVERGFRFLKDPMFFADAMYLHKPSRIMAMTMIMGLALLVYSLAERKLRQVLAEHRETIPDQKGRPTATPTLRRVFQVFEGIELLIFSQDGVEFRKTLNLKPIHSMILKLMGPAYSAPYGEPS